MKADCNRIAVVEFLITTQVTRVGKTRSLWTKIYAAPFSYVPDVAVRQPRKNSRETKYFILGTIRAPVNGDSIGNPREGAD